MQATLETQEDIRLYVVSTMDLLSKYRLDVESIARRFYTEADSLSFPQYGVFEHKLVGIYFFANTSYKELIALVVTVEAKRFNYLKIQAEIDRTKFVADVAKHHASEFSAELRKALAQVGSMVESIEQLLATCRKHMFVEKNEHHFGKFTR